MSSRREADVYGEIVVPSPSKIGRQISADARKNGHASESVLKNGTAADRYAHFDEEDGC